MTHKYNFPMANNTDDKENPWKVIPLSDYESHMKLDSVCQLQAMNHMMRRQFALAGADSAMILGVAGGNGLEHVGQSSFRKVYGVDINAGYLSECEERYPHLRGVFIPLCADLMDDSAVLPHASLLIANLLIEYIGCECFCRTVEKVDPDVVSCVIQVNVDDSFVSDSPYQHVFDNLEQVHRDIHEDELTQCMRKTGYRLFDKTAELLPNGKKLVELDFTRVTSTAPNLHPGA